MIPIISDSFIVSEAVAEGGAFCVELRTCSFETQGVRIPLLALLFFGFRSLQHECSCTRHVPRAGTFSWCLSDVSCAEQKIGTTSIALRYLDCEKFWLAQSERQKDRRTEGRTESIDRQTETLLRVGADGFHKTIFTPF